MALQWNANELAWARKNGVSLGAKTAGGLSQNADYKRITSGGGSSGGGGGGGGNQVAVGGAMYDANQKFDYYSGFGAYGQISAAQAAHLIAKGTGIGSNGHWDLDAGDQTGAYVRVAGKPAPQQKAAAPKAAAPRPSGGGGSSRPAPKQSAPLQKSFQNIDNTMNKKANQALEKDPYGIAKTKINQLAPETVRRSFLTNRGEEGSYSSHMVVDPKTGKAFNSAKDAKDAGITNWVYKFQYDKKMGAQEEESALAEESALTGEIAEGVEAGGTTEASRGYKWRNRNTTNQWYKY